MSESLLTSRWRCGAGCVVEMPSGFKYGIDSGEAIKTAPPVPSIIPKGIATPSLLSHIVTCKYADGLPLYRQEEIFSRLGVDVSRSSMGRWIVQCYEALIPVRNVLEDRLLSSAYVSCDETRTQVLKEKGRKAEAQSWMWVRTTPSDDKKIVLFDYDPSRSGEVAKRLFADYRGFLQVDGFGAYNVLGLGTPETHGVATWEEFATPERCEREPASHYAGVWPLPTCAVTPRCRTGATSWSTAWWIR